MRKSSEWFDGLKCAEAMGPIAARRYVESGETNGQHANGMYDYIKARPNIAAKGFVVGDDVPPVSVGAFIGLTVLVAVLLAAAMSPLWVVV